MADHPGPHGGAVAVSAQVGGPGGRARWAGATRPRRTPATPPTPSQLVGVVALDVTAGGRDVHRTHPSQPRREASAPRPRRQVVGRRDHAATGAPDVGGGARRRPPRVGDGDRRARATRRHTPRSVPTGASRYLRPACRSLAGEWSTARSVTTPGTAPATPFVVATAGRRHLLQSAGSALVAAVYRHDVAELCAAPTPLLTTRTGCSLRTFLLLLVEPPRR